MWFYNRILLPKGVDGMAKSADPDQTAPSSLIWVYAVCQGLSVWNLRIIMDLRAQRRGQFGRKSLPSLAHFFLFWAGGEVKKYRTYWESQNLDQNFSLNATLTSTSLRAGGWVLYGKTDSVENEVLLTQGQTTRMFNWAAPCQNQQNGMYAQWQLRSVWAFAQSVQCLCWLHEESFGP